MCLIFFREVVMQVTNRASFPVIAFGFHSQHGMGNDVLIDANETKVVTGPFIGHMDGGDCHIAVLGKLVCQETPDNVEGFQILQGRPLSIGAGQVGVTVRHHLDPVEEHVAAWRANFTRTTRHPTSEADV